jgi:hypothetical protein
MEKKENTPDPVEITVKLNIQQVAALGLMMDDALKATGMKHLQISGVLHKQISEQKAKATVAK